jgi:hypothetical protein
MKRFFLISALLIGLTSMVNAQDYNTGIGVRGGIFSGLTVKHFIGSNTAIEGLLNTRAKWNGFEITGLYEIHKPAFDVARLHWYFGGGGHIGSWGDSPYESNTVIGVDGILGLEYNIEEIPINIGLDWKPAFNLIGSYDPAWDGLALSVRFIF